MGEHELVVVASFLNEIDAQLAQGALEAGGITSMISSDDSGGLQPQLAMSGVRLLVRAEDVDQAAEILDLSE